MAQTAEQEAQEPQASAGEIEGADELVGGLEVPVAVGVHVAPHQVGDRQAFRAAGEALAALLAVEAGHLLARSGGP